MERLSRLLLARNRTEPDLVLEDIGDAVAFRRYRRRMPVRDLFGYAPADGNPEDHLLRSLRPARRIRVLAFAVRAPAAHKNDALPVRREAEALDLLAVVLRVGRDSSSGVLRRRGDPDIT